MNSVGYPSLETNIFDSKKEKSVRYSHGLHLVQQQRYRSVLKERSSGCLCTADVKAPQ